MNSPAEDPDALLAQLDADPTNTALRERAARALSEAARPKESFERLRGSFAHLNAHDDPQGPAPCLCRKCFRPDEDAVTVGGVALRRDFVTEKRRVLYFWAPESLREQAEEVRESVRQKMKKRFSKSRAPDPRGLR